MRSFHFHFPAFRIDVQDFYPIDLHVVLRAPLREGVIAGFLLALLSSHDVSLPGDDRVAHRCDAREEIINFGLFFRSGWWLLRLRNRLQAERIPFDNALVILAQFVRGHSGLAGEDSGARCRNEKQTVHFAWHKLKIPHLIRLHQKKPGVAENHGALCA